MKCLVHQAIKDPGKIITFSDTSWNSVVKNATNWINLDGEEQKIAVTYRDVFNGTKEDASKVYGYHMKCYSRFCDKQRIQRSEKRSLKRAATTSISETQSPPSNIPSTPSPKKRLRSHRPLSSTASSSSSGILPAVCIICKKTESYKKIFGKRTKDRLFQTQTLDGGLLREAATKKEDEFILKHIRDKDCVAIEVRYHEYCYKKYVKFLSTMSADVDKEESNLYKQTFEAFSRDYLHIIKLSFMKKFLCKYLVIFSYLSINVHLLTCLILS